MARVFATNNSVGPYTTFVLPSLLSTYGWCKAPGTIGTIWYHSGAAQYRFDGSANIMFVREWTGNTAVWHGSMAGITIANWNHYAVTYDGSSTANNPVIYINGVSVSVTRDSAPASALLGTTGTIVIGNNAAAGSGSRPGGTLQNIAMHNVVLAAGEVIEAMNYGWTPRGLTKHWPLLGDSPEPNYGGAADTGVVASAAVAAGPPCRSIFLPGELGRVAA